MTACDDSKIKGSWQTYYDQSLMIQLENNLRFVANFRYELKANITAEPSKVANMQTVYPNIQEKYNYKSVCNQTMIGFMQNLNTSGTMYEHQLTCFYAEKDKTQLYENQVARAAPASHAQKDAKIAFDEVVVSYVQTEGLEKENTTKASETKLDEPRKRQSVKKNGFLEMKPSSELNAQIEHVNSKNYTWKANTCLLTKDHQSYNKTLCEQEEKKASWVSLAQTAVEKIVHRGNGTSTSKAQKKVFTKNPLSGAGKYGEKTDEFFHSYTKAQKWAKKYKTPDEIPNELIPESYDFRNLDGYDYTGPLRDQAECGSCYTIGFIQAIEARLKLKYAHKSQAIPQLSPQFLLMCNYLNEGCAGGWAIFHGFLAENGHLVKEECAPYKARTKGDKCENYKDCPGYAKIKSSYYIGGYNFEPSEKLIQKEMLMHGPLVTEFKADDNFQMYRSGILSQDHIPNDGNTYNQKEESETIMVPSAGSIELAQTSAPQPA